MTFTDAARRRLEEVVGRGLVLGAEKLSKMSRADWSVRAVSQRAASTGDFLAEAGTGGRNGRHYGAYFSMPGWGFLALFDAKSGDALADSFLPVGLNAEKARLTRQDAIAELSNVMVGILANTLADACDTVCIISAPTVTTGRRETILKMTLGHFSSGGADAFLLTDIRLTSGFLTAECTLVVLASARMSGFFERETA